MPFYKVKLPIWRGVLVEGKAVEKGFGPGSEIELTEEEAKPLMAVLAIDAEPLDATQPAQSAIDLDSKQTADTTTTDGDKLPPDDKKATK